MNLVEILGGKNAITLRAWLLLLPISVFLTSAFAPDGPIGSYPEWMALGFLAHIITGIVLWSGKKLTKNFRNKKVTTALVISIFVVAGVARGFTVAHVGGIAEIIENPNYFARMRSGATLILVWSGFAAFIIDTNQRYIVAVRQLTQNVIEGVELAQNSQKIAQQYRNKVVNEVEGLLVASFSSNQTAKQLEQVTDQILEPVRQDIVVDELELGIRKIQDQIKSDRRITLLETVRAMYYKTPFNAATTTFVFLGSTVASRYWVNSMGFLLLDIALNIIWIFLVFRLAKRQIATTKNGVNFDLVLPVWLVTAYGAGVITYSLGPEGIIWVSREGILLSLTQLVSIILASALSAYRMLLRNKLSELKILANQLDWYRQVINQAIWSEKRRLTRLIHSKIQSRILATATRISRNNSDRILDEQELLELREVCLDAIHSSETVISVDNFVAELSELFQESVDIVLSVSVNATKMLNLDQVASTAAVEIIREAVNNAIKHSNAKEIHIEIDLMPSELYKQKLIQIEISNNGETKLEANRKGIGSHILDEISLDWSLKEKNGLVQLVARIPVNSCETSNLL